MHAKVGLLIFFSVLIQTLAPSYAQVDADSPIPKSCENSLNTQRDWQQCADDAKPNQLVFFLAHANLGTKAYHENDMEKAAYHYDLSEPEGYTVFSDTFLQVFRSDVFTRIGRTEDAMKDVEMVVQQLELDTLGIGRESIPITDEILLLVYPTLLMTMHELEMKDVFDNHSAIYDNIAAQDDIDLTNKAAVFIETAQYPRALRVSNRLIKNNPDNAVALNNHCYLLALMEDFETAIPYCENAISLEPELAGFYHSYAKALAGVKKCTDAIGAIERARSLEPSTVLYQEKLVPCEP